MYNLNSFGYYCKGLNFLNNKYEGINRLFKRKISVNNLSKIKNLQLIILYKIINIFYNRK